MTTTTASLPASQERALLITLAAVQFANVLDFMIMMPLGAKIMGVFAITPREFSWLVAAYGTAAAISGFAGGFVLDRFDRRNALLVLFSGFTLATFACAIAPTYLALLFARLAAGAFGGVAGSVVTAMVGDVIPPERRGRAMSTVMSAFPLASIAGVPLSIILANAWEWHAPFYLLTVLSLIVLFIAARTLPHVPSQRGDHTGWRQMRAILVHPVHQRGFWLGGLLMFAGAAIVPFMAPSLIKNVGISESQLPFIYLVGGTASFFAMPWLGRMSDRYDKLHVLMVVTLPACLAVLVLTHLGPTPLPLVLPLSAFFFVGMASRFPPAMAMITNSVEARYRGGFMSVISAIQQAAAGLANVASGLLVTADADGRLIGFNRAGFMSVTAFAFTVWMAWRLRVIAPYAARNPHEREVATASPPSGGPAANTTYRTPDDAP
ncbi:MFS transporter [Actomonas aquatica]|uniref:MFS transporter n=1 Tax=Actomonas aquatica TaxID=2866162 RepID=A0ABZ1CEP5_9BACT|nr:MFS transporter [Opitutus sp. WL0086]WRQ89882.1 MFS transporter [Opitutus sp. WL0086]